MRSPHDQRSDAKDDVLPKHRLPNSWLRHHPSAGGSNGGGPPDIDRNSAGTRMLATQTVFSLIDAWLRLSMLDDGRVCTGDSGAPNFLGNTDLVVAIGIWRQFCL